jgi:hypothetical protein
MQRVYKVEVDSSASLAAINESRDHDLPDEPLLGPYFAQ